MGLMSIFGVAGSGMSAQSTRLNTIASNLSNAETPANSEKTVYKARYPVFQTALNQVTTRKEEPEVGVAVSGIYESKLPARKIYQPGHAMADKEGYVYYPNVNSVDEMANMISTSRSYQMNAQVLNTAKSMLLKTLQLGQ